MKNSVKKWGQLFLYLVFVFKQNTRIIRSALGLTDCYGL